jgi:hypothetical protein
MNEKKAWIIVQPTINGISLSRRSKEFAISSKEIMILSNNIGIFDIEQATTNKFLENAVNDIFYYNSVYKSKQKVFTIGNGGNIHIYNMNKKTFEVIQCPNVICLEYKSSKNLNIN